MTTHSSGRIKMSSIQYAWGRLPPCIFHDQTSPDVTETKPCVSNISATDLQGIAHYNKLPADSVLTSQNIDNFAMNATLGPCVESGNPAAAITTHQNTETAESVDTFILVPKPIEMAFEHCKVSSMKCLACAHNRVVFVNDTGHIVVFKSSNDTPNAHTKIGPGIELIDSLSAHNITSVSCGEHHTVALTSTGQVYTWGDNTYGQLGQDPELMRHSELPIVLEHSSLETTSVVQISSRTNFNIILTDTGDLYSWGENKYGQLGLGTICKFQWSPHHISSMNGLCIVQISCGGSHSLCLTISGSVFGWGRNHCGQLGVGTSADSPLPKQLETLQHQKVHKIICGDKHSAALSKEGRIYTFGSGEYGQLGHNSTNNESLPKIVLDFLDANVTHVACGRAHTVVNIRCLETGANSVYSFGAGSNGQIGYGDLTGSLQPVRITEMLVTNNLGEFICNDILTVATLLAGGDQTVLRFASKKDVDNSDQVEKSQPLLLTSERIENCSDDVGKRNLKRIVSSANCLNGSFLYSDDHYSCSLTLHGLDLKLAEDIFTQIDGLTDTCFRNEICDVISTQLIPNLENSPIDIEAMRIYLILPLSHPFQDPRNVDDILAPFAEKILQLESKFTVILTKWWSIIPCRNFIWLKNIYQEAISYIVHSLHPITPDSITALENLACCLELLKKLYEVNETRETKIPFTEFYIPALNEKIVFANDVATKFNMERGIVENQFVLCDYPFIFDMNAKTTLLKASTHIQKQNAVEDEQFWLLFDIHPDLRFVLKAQRNNLVISAMINIDMAIRSDQEMMLPLKIIFDGEEGIDDGGITKEFFLLLQDELLSDEYDIFEEDENSRLIWFKPQPTSEKWKTVTRALGESNAYAALGAFCSLAIYNNVIVDFHFPTVLYKKILNTGTVSLEDLIELNPDYNSFYRLLDMPDKDVEAMEQYFEMNIVVDGEVRIIELIPNGSQIQVNAANRKDYVDKYVDYILNKSIEEPFQKFRQGFLSVFSEICLNLFRPEEIQDLIIGNTKYEWEVLKETCIYRDVYHKGHKTIKYFWKVFMDFDEDEKKKFLLFLTGSSRIPIAGMKAVQMTIEPVSGWNVGGYLPTAHTCFNLLHLPMYKSKEVLKEKLSMAICVTGFGIQ